MVEPISARRACRLKRRATPLLRHLYILLYLEAITKDGDL
jgi:hypothetical protein